MVLGRPASFSFDPTPGFVPPEAAVLAASQFKGRSQPAIAEFLRKGNIVQDGTKFAQEQSEKRWAAGTVKNKHTAVRLFLAFLVAAGKSEVATVTPSEDAPKLISVRRREENLLATWGMLRVMSGQRMKGAEQCASQVRTWYKHLHGAEFGIKGTGTEAGGAVKAIRSCQEYFPPKNVTADEGRSPVTLPILKALVVDAMARGDVDVAVAEAVAFNGLYRMGELTATDRRFDWKKDLTEADIEFEPSYKHATKVIVRIGASKNDQDGMKAEHHPRILPVTNDFLSAGRLLKELFRIRFKLGVNDELPHGAASRYKPLFQDLQGGQLKESKVLSEMRRVLRVNKYSEAATKNFGTHSFRIGGFTRYFHVGTPIEVLRSIGGWSSDAWKACLRFQRENAEVFTAKLCVAAK